MGGIDMFKITMLFVATCYLFATANAQALPAFTSSSISSAGKAHIQQIVAKKKKSQPKKPCKQMSHSGVSSIKICMDPGS